LALASHAAMMRPMSPTPAAFARRLLACGQPFVVVAIADADGSTPRETGAAIAVGAAATAGTIGGGRLEWEAIEEARAMLREGSKARTRSIALGPSIGQCCGGRVTLAFAPGDERAAEALEAAERLRLEARPLAFIHGAGHVGRALALALAPLPIRVRLVDGRREELAMLAADDRIEHVLSDAPAALAAAAPAGAAHVVMTHSHALDSLIAAALLERGDFAYLGLIGSATKKALFLKAFRELDLSEAAVARIVCPIGGAAVRDKRPEVIAALAAAEIVTALFGQQGGR
jgi:xanthine dehydrogenase accessory factor